MINILARGTLLAALILGTGLAAAQNADPCERALVVMSTDDGAAKVILRVLDPGDGEADAARADAADAAAESADTEDADALSPAAVFEIIVDRGPAATERWGLIRAPVRAELMPSVVGALSRELAKILDALPQSQRRSVNTRERGRVATITRLNATTFEVRALNDAVTAAVVIDRRDDPVSIALDRQHSVIEIGEVNLAAEYLSQLMLARLFPDAAEADIAVGERGSVH